MARGGERLQVKKLTYVQIKESSGEGHSSAVYLAAYALESCACTWDHAPCRFSHTLFSSAYNPKLEVIHCLRIPLLNILIYTAGEGDIDEISSAGAKCGTLLTENFRRCSSIYK